MPQPSISVKILRDSSGNYYLPDGVSGRINTFCTLPSGMQVLNNLSTVFLNPTDGTELPGFQEGAIIASKIQNPCDLSYAVAKESIYKIENLLTKGCRYLIKIRPTVIFTVLIDSGVITLNADQSFITGLANYQYKIYYTDNAGHDQITTLPGLSSGNSFNLSTLINWNNNVFRIELTVTDTIGSGMASYDYIPTHDGGMFISHLTNGCKDNLSNLGDFNDDFNSDFFN